MNVKKTPLDSSPAAHSRQHPTRTLRIRRQEDHEVASGHLKKEEALSVKPGVRRRAVRLSGAESNLSEKKISSVAVSQTRSAAMEQQILQEADSKKSGRRFNQRSGNEKFAEPVGSERGTHRSKQIWVKEEEKVKKQHAVSGRTEKSCSEHEEQGIRLSKLMAMRGMCSRREADGFIAQGWVFVDGRRISELGTRVKTNARIMLAPEAARTQSSRVTILLHKPIGYVSGQPEPGYRPAVELIRESNQFECPGQPRFQFSHLKGLAPAGRLDIDSTGLLVLTQDGRIARHLIGEDSEIEKEYLVRVEGQLIDNGLALLQQGLELDGRPLRPARVEWINEDQLRFRLREGRKRQIRRMCEQVGLYVVGLKRVRIGRVKLGDLPLGEWRYLDEGEMF